ncbi:DNA-processing protein DprA [Amycolatopsis sp. NPDC059657]|uniref:DNA-processing protein DprA n=1 Tax=Amycolatopsis sp. NPDC059657 TaxID=3346899 RepID=UPI00366D6430
MTITVDVLARLYLLNATEPPAPAVHDFVAAHGVVEAVNRIRGRTAPPAVLAEIVHPDATVDDDVSVIESGAARLVTPEGDDWPHHLLRGMAEHGLGVPLGLWLRGSARLTDLTCSAVTVVGCRAATDYGAFVAAELGVNLAHAGVTVVTGGAVGIETEAMRGAVVGEGPAIAVLPCGTDVAYPQSNGQLISRVLDCGGLVVSEYPAGRTPARSRHVARHRLVAALASTTVVVEAGARSGALVTAHAACVLGRHVRGVPGPITSWQSTGTNELLRAGGAAAITSTSVDDLLQSRGLR